MADKTGVEPYAVRVIANPGAGGKAEIAGPLSDAYEGTGIRWDIDVTNGPGEEGVLARRAVEDGAKVVVAFGGDGTVSAVADAIAGSDAVLGILPGGTANVLAKELGIPLDVDEAAKLLAGEHDERSIDLGTAVFDDGTERTFILRVSAGLEATAVEESASADKARLGEIAYIITGLRQLQDPPVAAYLLTSPDGGRVEVDGLFAVLANSGHMGMADAKYAPGIAVDDGVLDGLIAPAAVPQLVSAAAAALAGSESENVERLSASELRLECDPPQRVTVDGEVLGDTPVTVRVRPSAIRVIVPSSVTK